MKEVMRQIENKEQNDKFKLNHNDNILKITLNINGLTTLIKRLSEC